jgi:hypothetical protein
MKNNKYLPVIAGLILTVITPLIVLNFSYFKGFTSLDMFGYALAFVLIIGSVFLFYIVNIEDKLKENNDSISGVSTLQNADFKKLATEISHFSQAIKSKENFVYAVKKEELYTRMNEFLLNAHNRIDLMYLAEKPPYDYQKSDAKNKYLKELEQIITQNKITVRRLIVYSNENKAWIKEFTDTHKDIKTFSLYILDDKLINAVSIQIFDDSKAVLVNLDSSDSSLKSRDIIIESKQLNQIFESYYDRILKKAIPIVENGKLNIDNYRKYL